MGNSFVSENTLDAVFDVDGEVVAGRQIGIGGCQPGLVVVS